MNVKLKVLSVGALFFLGTGIASAQTQKKKKIDSLKTENIEEVVVVAYGKVKKESLVGAQSSIGSKDLETRPVTNVTNALAGKASGVQVLTSSGQPGSKADITIRGFGSVNASSDPLIVLDGTIYTGSLADIPSQDIESFSVLKDAASTAIYGSSAGNGVLMITTKGGKKKSKPSITFSSTYGFITKGQQDYDKVGAKDFYRLRWQQYYNDYKYNDVPNKPDLTKYNHENAGVLASSDVNTELMYNPFSGIQSYYEQLPDGSFRLTTSPTQKNNWLAIVMADGTINPEAKGLLYANDLDWKKALFRTGIRSENSISGSYATDKLHSYMSLGYLTEDGYRIATGYERFTARANVSYDANSWLSLGTNMSLSIADYTEPKSSGATTSNSFDFIRNIGPIYPIHQHNEDGSYVLDKNGNYVYDYSKARPYRGNYNPILESYMDLSSLDKQTLGNRSFISIKLMPGLKFTTNLSYDVYRTMTKLRYNNIEGDQPQGLLNIGNTKNQAITFNELLEYDKEYGSHHINLLAGHENFKNDMYGATVTKKGTGFAGIDEVANYSLIDNATSFTNKYRKEGYFGRVNYDYKNKYNLSASIRRDGTSRLAEDYRWGTFWAVGGAWRVSKEAFLSNVKWLDNLSLRASYGRTGNDAILNGSGSQNYYAYQTTYALDNYNNTYPGIRVSNFANSKLLWETQINTDFAVEFGLFRRIKATVEFFDKESKDLIFAVPLPASTGIADINKNIGKVRNYGVEMNLDLKLVKSENFDWNINWNGTILKNKIVKLPDENRENGIDLSTKARTPYKYMEGGSIYDFYLNDWIGVDPDTGRSMYRIDAEKYADNADPNSQNFVGIAKTGAKAGYTYDTSYAKKVFSGSSIPKITGGFGTDFRIGRFDFAANFAYQLGGKVYDAGYAELMQIYINQGAGHAIHTDLQKAWQKPGDITNVPGLNQAFTRDEGVQSNRYLISSDALMFKSANVTYNFPKEVAEVLKVTNMKIGISAENLYLWSKRKGMNPMMSYGGYTSAAGYDFARTITANFSVTF